jgi:hypothetical protein
MFGHKLRYEIKITFGEISLKLRQTNWDVARNNVVVVVVVVVVDELSSQIPFYTCLTIDIWTRQRRCTVHQRDFMRFGAILPNWRAASGIGIKSFRLYYEHP